ncbi:unnamed protein product [Ilex paraguariensis]|uniref:Stress-response A/B barrel domain-containing protein n=1 Tax=Ilex paraguariensis TaxID=185542 RepID=A0ABC8TZ37_9AQUA
MNIHFIWVLISPLSLLRLTSQIPPPPPLQTLYNHNAVVNQNVDRNYTPPPHRRTHCPLQGQAQHGPSQVNAFVNGLNSLTSINQVLHLTAGALLRTRSQSLSFTHILHTRYKSQTDLADYKLHPSHVSVVDELITPIVDDIMSLDWVNDDVTVPVVINPGSAMRVTEKKVDPIDQISFGEKISVKAKGYTIGSIRVFPGLSELEELDSNLELVNENEKVKELLDSVLVVDYVVPQIPIV